jgi:hypothetical protein
MAQLIDLQGRAIRIFSLKAVQARICDGISDGIFLRPPKSTRRYRHRYRQTAAKTGKTSISLRAAKAHRISRVASLGSLPVEFR